MNAVQQEQDEATAIAEAMAGYNGTRGDEPPVIDQPDETPEGSTQVATAPATVDTPATPAPEPSFQDEIRALKEKVTELKDAGADAATVRRMFGEIGSINRTLQQMQQQPQHKQTQEPPAEDELAAALKSAEAVAEDWPDVAGPIVKSLKALQAAVGKAQPSAPAPAFDPESVSRLVDQRVTQELVSMNVNMLDAMRPNWAQIVGNPGDKTDYRAWLATQPGDYQQRLLATNSAYEINRSIDEFEKTRATQQQKQNRLAAATVTRNTAAPASSVIPDEEGLNIGYYGGQKKPARR